MHSPKIDIRKLCTLVKASPHHVCDQRNSEEKRTCAITSLNRPRETQTFSKREVKSQRHCLPAPCGSTKSSTSRNAQSVAIAVSTRRASSCRQSSSCTSFSSSSCLTG